MNPKKHIKDFNKRFNINSSDSSDSSESEELEKFKERIRSVINKYEDYITADSMEEIRQYYGNNRNHLHDYVTVFGNNKADLVKLAEVLILTIKTSRIYTYPDDDYPPGVFRNEIIKAIEYSDIGVIAKESEGRILLHPEGDQELDEILVNQTLSFLNDKSNRYFEEALTSYQKKEGVKSAESLRRSLEEFLRYKLENTKGLKENIGFLQKRLKKSTDVQVRNIIFQTFNCLDQYFNENTKHGDRDINETENEFLIYQIGLLLRYIEKLHLDESKKV